MGKILMVLMMVLAACAVETTEPEVTEFPTTELTAVGPDGWSARVAGAANVWNEALTDLCGFAPFEMVEDGMPVELVDEVNWDRNYVGATGLCYPDKVLIRNVLSPEGQHAVLVHELGHALGLDHVDDPDSVMNKNHPTSVPSESDIEAAAEALGCL